MQLKYLFAAVLGIAFALIATIVVGLPLGVFEACALAVLDALVVALFTERVRRVNWGTTIVLLVAGAGFFWGLNRDGAVYLLIPGLGFLAGTLSVLFAGNGRPN